MPSSGQKEASLQYKGLGHERQESQALPPARLLSPIKLPLVGVVQSEAGRTGSSWHRGDFYGRGDFDIHGRVLATSPVRHQNISWAPVVTRKEETTLLNWPGPAATAVSKIASLRALCRLMRSPPEPEQSAWSPRTSLSCRHAGQGPRWSKTGNPRRYFTTSTNSTGRR